MVKKEILIVNDYDLIEGMLVYAISSSESDILICQIINRFLGINLALGDNVEISRKNIVVNFRRYNYLSHDEIEKYVLLVNRHGGHYLFPEIKKIDYIFIIATEAPKEPIEAKIQDIKNIPEISAIYKINQSKLKAVRHIHF